MLQQLRHHPIPPRRPAEPPGELTYGEALTLLKLALLPTPAIWRDAAGNARRDGARRRLRGGEASPGGSAEEPFHRAFEQNTALVCADSPAQQNARQWPQVVHQLEGVSRHRGTRHGLAGSRVRRLADPQARTATPDRWNAATANPILLIGHQIRPHDTPGQRQGPPSGGWAMPCC